MKRASALASLLAVLLFAAAILATPPPRSVATGTASIAKSERPTAAAVSKETVPAATVPAFAVELMAAPGKFTPEQLRVRKATGWKRISRPNWVAEVPKPPDEIAFAGFANNRAREKV